MRPHQRLLQADDIDPMASVANLFDAAMGFAVALLIALVAHGVLSVSQTTDKRPDPLGEVIEQTAQTLTSYRESSGIASGEGERLGIAYRLKNGDVVYVPARIRD